MAKYTLIQFLCKDRKILSEWIKCFSQYSFNNDIYALISFHVLLGQMIRKSKIQIGSQHIDPRVSLFLLQGSGSGKSAGWDYVSEVSNKLKLSTKSITEATDAALLGSFKERKVTRRDEFGNKAQVTEYDATEGSLKDCDIVHYDEASILLNRPQNMRNALFYFQRAMNPIGSDSNVIERQLKAGTVTITPMCSFIFTSYMPKNMEEIALETGLLQRCITFPRYLSKGDRLKNEEFVSSTLFSSPERRDPKNIIEFLRYSKKYDNQEIVLSFSPDLKNVFRNQITHIREKVLKNIRPDVEEIMESFLSRLNNHLVILSIHSSIMRGEAYNLKTTDIEYAGRIMFYVFQHLINWFESDLVILSAKKESREMKYRRFVLRIIREPVKWGLKIYNDGISKADIIKLVSKELKISVPTATKYVPMFIEEMNHFVPTKKLRTVFYKPTREFTPVYGWWKVKK